MAEKEKPPAPKGRGQLLEKLRKHREEREKLAALGPYEPPKARGRAAALALLKEKHKSDVASISSTLAKTKIELQEEDSEEKYVEPVIEAAPQPLQFQGIHGQPVRVTCNYIMLEVEPNRGIFEYEVRFNPVVDARFNRTKIVSKIMSDLNVAKTYDGGSCLYLSITLEQNVMTFQVPLPTDPETIITTTLIYKKKKSYADSNVIHFYNILFKRIMKTLEYSRIGRNYFNTNTKHSIPQHKLEVYPGYAVAVEEREGGLMVCVDTQHRVVRDQNVYEAMHDYQRRDPRTFKDWCTKNLIGSVVLCKYNNQTVRIDDINWGMNPQSKFTKSSGEEISFIDYYKNNYNLTIHDVNQPLLLSRKTLTTPQGKVENMIYLVPELCFLTGLSQEMRDDFTVMKDVAAFTRISASARLQAIRTYLNNVNQSPECQKILGDWGLKLAKGTTDINARVLPNEKICFIDGEVSGPDWNNLVTKKKITGPVDLYKWIVVYTTRDERCTREFVDTMLRLSRQMGCSMKPPQLVRLNDSRHLTYKDACMANIKSDTQAVVFVCPSNRTDLYNTIKGLCCVNLPCASQVVISKNLCNPKKTPTIIAKIGLQINCKLGGTLWSVKMPMTGWMVIGIDAYHGGKMDSVCAFVASTNQSFTKYFSEAFFQRGEIGDFYKSAVKSALANYIQNVGGAPTVIIVYRDGVGDGQLESVRQYEIPQFEQGIAEMGLDIKLTFIIVQKRISTRIFIAPSGNNPDAGTLIDKYITKSSYYDFYLVPQTVRQGTVNPSHYIVLQNKGEISADHLQRFSYKLCHLYYNWAGTVRIPAPCIYAHKLAQLVGLNIKKSPHQKLNNYLYYL